MAAINSHEEQSIIPDQPPAKRKRLIGEALVQPDVANVLGESGIENQHVHAVYEQIADHFHETRFSYWPLVTNFLKQTPPNSIIGDIGCGNGKYLQLQKELEKSGDVKGHSVIVGCDRCISLIKVASERGPTLIVDNLSLPFRSESFDAIISIAVLHHFASAERRIQALAELFRVTRSGGRIMVSVWAFEQEKREYPSQDSLIPWMYRGQPDTVYQRYYHLFQKGELEQLAQSIGNVELVESVWDYDNWYCTFKKN